MASMERGSHANNNNKHMMNHARENINEKK